MEVCDKCYIKGNLKDCKIGERNYKLCTDCSNRINDWIAEGKQNKGVLGNLFK
jgi:hypothetical protein